MRWGVDIINLINYLNAIKKEADKIDRKYSTIEYTFYFLFPIYNYKKACYKREDISKWDNGSITLDGVKLDKDKDFVAYDIIKEKFIILEGKDIYSAEFIDDKNYLSFMKIIRKNSNSILTWDYIASRINFVFENTNSATINDLIAEVNQVANKIRAQYEDNKSRFIIVGTIDEYIPYENETYNYYPTITIDFAFDVEEYLSLPHILCENGYNFVKKFKNSVTKLAVKHNILYNSLIFNTEILGIDYDEIVEVFITFSFYNFLELMILADLLENY